MQSGGDLGPSMVFCGSEKPEHALVFRSGWWYRELDTGRGSSLTEMDLGVVWTSEKPGTSLLA